ncbi:M50 family metallopeptidase [Halalkalibacter urbisdiaboli]|uniref:M50 family metallopeptidase n=1 Tax=Halalkalibacter urbisdiaboli TaxID=1960589 RepID=UPI001FD93533|nr:M50 family metallopeptidase [Halalkalibacter urbisdiaboli]
MGIVTGYFREVIMVFFIVFIHELGHAFAAHYFKWRILKIELLPFGGVAEVEDNGNRPFREELIIIIAGPIQHLWLIGLSFLFIDTSFWTVADHQLFIWHNLTILFFNLIPVVPLDGGRLVQLWCTYRWPYQKALAVSRWLSGATLVSLVIISGFLFPFHLNLWVVLSFLILANYLEWRQRHFRFMRFLMARQSLFKQQSFRYKTIRAPKTWLVRDTVKLFQRGFFHRIMVFDENKHLIALEEPMLLHSLFEEKQLQARLVDLIRKNNRSKTSSPRIKVQ